MDAARRSHDIIGRVLSVRGSQATVGLAEANSDPAVVITQNNERAEAEAPTPFDHLRAAIDEDHLFGGLLGVRLVKFRIRPVV
jgi:hypothetical protein